MSGLPATAVPPGTFEVLRRPFRLAAGGALSLVAVVAILATADMRLVRDAIAVAPREPGVLALAALCYTVAFVLRAWVWQRLLTTRIGLGALVSILQTALFVNHVLPVKAGEVVRPALAVRRGVPIAEAASSTVVARALDFAALLLVAVIALPSGDSLEEGWALRGVAGVALLLGLGAAGLVLLRHGHAPVPTRFTRIAAKFALVQESLRAIRVRTVLLVAPVVVASWVLEPAVLLAAARLLGLELTVEAAVGATAFAVLFQIVHVTPGGLGVYEASMTSILVWHGVPAEAALALALVTHGLKFAYSYSVGLACAIGEGVAALRGSAHAPRVASRLEVFAARAWNVLNEGKPFTPVFALGVIALLSLPRIGDASYWRAVPVALIAVAPLALLCWRFDFPLRLRAGLWLALALWVAAFRFVSVPAAALIVALYLGFTVVMWGTVYYHLRIGTPWSNILRFWRLVLENPDPTSGNFLEQLPKLLLLVWTFEYVVASPTLTSVVGVEVFAAAFGLGALLVHQWWFTWVPALPQPGLAQAEANASIPSRTAKRVIVIAIDGCRADRLREARTPCLDRLRAEGVEFTNVSTVYPARTVTGFASMLTGAAPAVHGMRSNFVPSLGVKCESVFDVLRARGMRGVLVGIAHLIDAFGERDVRSVTAVMHNDEIDLALVERAKRVLDQERPELLVLQLLSVDQTGHSRGSYNAEYLRKIEVTDGLIASFLSWCEQRGYLEDAAVVLTSDHGQGIGIGGHGHMSPPEITVPCILWGAGIEVGPSSSRSAEQRFITDLAPTVAHLLGAPAPAQSVGRDLLAAPPAPRGPVFVIPAHNEEANLPAVLASIARLPLTGHSVIVVDDGSRDRTAEVAAAHGAHVVRHAHNRGLGAALRTGLAAARDLRPSAVVYLDADGEYDPPDALALLAPIARGEADYVLGRRANAGAGGMTRSRRAANRAFSVLQSVLCGRWIADGQTGMRAFSPRALDVAEIVHDYNYAQVLTLDLLHKGMRLAQVPVRYTRRTHGRSFITLRYLWRVPLGIARELFAG